MSDEQREPPPGPPAGSGPGREHDRRKQSLYFPESMLDEMRAEAQRLGRSLSWVVQRAWKHARKEIGKIPGTDR